MDQYIDKIPHVLILYTALLLSLSVHEASHAGAAYMLGDDTASSRGRLSLNPIVHMDLLGTVIFPLMGLIFGGFFIGWAKPVPYNPNRFRPTVSQKAGGAFVSFAGPLSNLVLSLIFIIVLCLSAIALAPVPQARFAIVRAAFQGTDALSTYGVSTASVVLLSLAAMLVQINVLLAFFNLIPLGPLDGAGVLRGFVPNRLLHRFDKMRYHPAMWVILLILLFTGVVGFFLFPVLSLYSRYVTDPVARLILGA